MVKIACISDTHNHYPNIPGCDILIHAGDLTNLGSISEIEKSLSWLSKQDAETIITSGGNHDWLLEKDKHLAKSMCSDYGINLLINEGMEVSGLKVWGSPNTPFFCDWAFNSTQEELYQYWSMIPEDTDILVTHGPAYGILDRNPGGRHCGCRELLRAINKLNLRYHIFGHIHHEYGSIPLDKYTAINASLCTEQYKCINPVQVIEI